MRNFVKMTMIFYICVCMIVLTSCQSLEGKMLELGSLYHEIEGYKEENRSQLEVTEKEPLLYKTIQEGLLEMQEEINLSLEGKVLSSEEVFSVVEQVIYDTPEILYYNGCEYWNDGRLRFKYKKDLQTNLTHTQQLKEKADEIITKVIQPEMSDYEKEIAIHDYIIEHAVYDSDSYEEKTLLPESYSAYGVLVLGKGTCEGYTKAMQLLMNGVGIECIFVSGTADGVAHSWNIVKIDGEYYHVDLTWDDPVNQEGKDVLRYDYFNLTNDEMRRDHLWNPELYPLCQATKYNYYVQNKLVVGSYQEYYDFLERALMEKKKTILLKVLNFETKTYDVGAAIEKIIQNNPKARCRGCRFSVNKTMGIISVNVEYQQ